MKRPEKKKEEHEIYVMGYNDAIDDFTAFLPSEEELLEIILCSNGTEPAYITMKDAEEIAKAIHKRLS